MKLLRKQISKDGGSVFLVPQDAEDMWFVYNILQEGDELETTTTRKLTNEKSQPRVKLRLRIRIQKIELDLPSSIIRINGRTCADHKDVPLNSFHTLQLEPDLPFELYKQEFDSFCLSQIEQSVNIENKSDIGALVLQPGLAHLCLVTDTMTVLRQKLELTIPKKRREDNQPQERATLKFFDQCYNALKASLPLSKLKVVLIAGPGHTPQQLLTHITQRAMQTEDKEMTPQIKKFVVVHASSGHMTALQEALAKPEIQREVANTRFGLETKVMNEFFESLNNDDMRAWYGYEETLLAVRENAIKTLMVTDALFRSSVVEERKRYIQLCEDVKNLGREVLVLSSLHDSGEQLDSVSGVACLLLYPLDIDEVAERQAEAEQGN